MRELHAPTVQLEGGERLSVLDYRSDFQARRELIRNGDSWKLERRQHFEETNPRRDTLRRGDWAEVLRTFEAERPAVREAVQNDEKNGHTFHRLRVFEEPLTPYMQWELHWLHMRAECGFGIRMLPAEAVAASETAGYLPELVVMDGKVLYQVLYSDAGATEGALRFTDPALIAPWEAFIRDAYAAAEDIRTYFERAVAHLPPPPAA
jgi:hypothetical protein